MNPTREILWNVSSIGNVIAMYGLLVVAVLIGALGVFRHAELVATGKDAPEHLGRPWFRFLDLYQWGLFQRGVVKQRFAAAAHTLVYFGFLVLLFTTTMVFIDHDLGIRIYQGKFYLAVTILSDVFGFGLLLGCLLFAHRRYIENADLVHNRAADGLFLAILILLVVQGFILEGLRIYVTNDPWALYSPVGYLVSKAFYGLSVKSASTLHYLTWWFHTLTVYLLVAAFPYSKAFHILASSANLYFRANGRAKGALKSPGDLDKLLESGEDFSLGLDTIKDYSWKQLLDLEACTSCGRCQDACPAYNSGKPLSPKWLILDSRNHALALHTEQKLTVSKLPKPLAKFDALLTSGMFLSRSGLTHDSQSGSYLSSGSFRAANKLVQESSTRVGGSAERSIAGDVINEDLFWACTTCHACVTACPVGINHVDHIVEHRRNMALMKGKIPHEAQGTLKALENRGNPFGAPEERISWLSGLDVPILKPGDAVDYLYWVGCVSAYDKRKQKIARSLAKIMNAAGLSFGILGTVEGCTGDPARRLGEENLFQTLAKKNIDILRSVSFKTLVANCPHCFNTIKNEYPQFGNLADGKEPEIIHHSVLLKRLLAEKKITVGETYGEYTFHDPCYLGRYNDEYEAPRDSIKAVKGLKIIEMEKSKEQGRCCGAGGGHFWMDMKVGERVNVMRTEQAAATGAGKVATACPFCMQMMEDGAKLTGREESLQVRDIAEVIAENLVTL